MGMDRKTPEGLELVRQIFKWCDYHKAFTTADLRRMRRGAVLEYLHQRRRRQAKQATPASQPTT